MKDLTPHITSLTPHITHIMDCTGQVPAVPVLVSKVFSMQTIIFHVKFIQALACEFVVRLSMDAA